ncbi:hypothetical protein KO494_07390 [Lacinutrix sp. C3R15]|uniref:hypothetical protein n=1 Tax=Flavobacteriaceae TaxID=49546 RepID=UPI001C096F33|nr:MULTISPECIES: hypothetical protein [Flavobacteriaceae]MBU2939360.1 hypothetical protein [Lacinutrix sp. C3R15]MDO6622675.1 hypothetical protein [Oceanihabitans sp. 1_MG-2023]
MFKCVLKYRILLFFSVICITACVSDIDFSQSESLTISPTLDASVIYFDTPASTFVGEGEEQTIVRDSVNVDVFTDAFIVDNVAKVLFLFEATNTINRNFQAQVDLLDQANVLQHTFTFSVAASLNQEEILAEHLEIFENQSLQAFKQTTKLVITLTLMPSNDGSILTEDSPGNLQFRSKATFYLNIDSST